MYAPFFRLLYGGGNIVTISPNQTNYCFDENTSGRVMRT